MPAVAPLVSLPLALHPTAPTILLLLPLPRLQGYQLMTPLRQQQPQAAPGPGGRAVMVNRGWVPKEWREDAELRRAGQPTGKVRGAVWCGAVNHT